MLLTLRSINRERIEYRLQDGDTVVDLGTIGRNSNGAIRRLSERAGIEYLSLVEQVVKCTFTARVENPTITIPIIPKAPDAPPSPVDTSFTVYIRGIAQPDLMALPYTAATPEAAIRGALANTTYPFDQPIIKWEDTNNLAVADIDYHNIELSHRHTRETLELWASQLQPTPIAYHVSHGDGMKLYYVTRDGIPADELAAVAGVAWLQFDPRAAVDVCRSSRHPAYVRVSANGILQHCGPVHSITGNANTSAVSKWFARDADPHAITDWLEDRGLQRGQRLPHTECPIAPSASTGDGPVMIGDSGIYCFICSARGRTVSVSSTHAGFVPWASIVGGVNSTVYNMAKNFAHWEHARLVLAGILTLGENVLRLAYSAVLRSIHGADDPRIPQVFAAGRDMIRTQGRWQTADGTITYTRDIAAILSTLPACKYTETNGHANILKVKSSAELVNRFQQAGVSLADYGYPHLTPIRGYRVYGHHIAYTDSRIPFTTMSKVYRENPRLAPKYLPTRERSAASVAAAWEIVRTCYPGVNEQYLKLLICTKGCAEGRTSQAPFLYVHGGSGAAKSSTAMLAASICGDVATEIIWDADVSRFRSSIRDALDKGTFVVVNEIIKDAALKKVEPRAAMDPILNLTPDSISHKLFFGPTPLGNVPALVCTDTSSPRGFSNDVQLARRLIYVRLNGRLEWREPLMKAGIGSPERFREASEDYANAANIILSEIIDDYFRYPQEIETIANSLGFTTLEKYEGCGEAILELQRFAQILDMTPRISGKDAELYSPEGGWRAIRFDSGDTLCEAWTEIADGPAGEPWKTSRRCDAADWSKILNESEPVYFDVRPLRRGVIIARLRAGNDPKWPIKVTGWKI